MRTQVFQQQSGNSTGDVLGPEPLSTTFRFDGFRTLLGTLMFLVLSVFLTSASLVNIAERMEFGPERDRWLSAAEVVHEASTNLYLDRPGRLIRTVVDYEDAPDQDGPDEVVILGELALSDAGIEVETDVETPETVEPEALAPEPPVEPEPEPASEPPALREVTEEDPLRIWLGGDSLGQFMAAHIAYRIAPSELTDIDINYRISTGLARPDYFDWPGHLTTVLADQPRPEAIVFMVGGNDDQAMRFQSTVLEVNTPEWREEYSRRVGLVMDVTAYADTRLFWVLLPPMKEDRREGISDQTNAIVARHAEQRPWVTAIDIDDLLVGPDGTYARFVDDPNGDQQLARQPDGVHITEIGSRWIADRLWEEVTGEWPTVDPEAVPATAGAPDLEGERPQVSPDE